MRIEHGSDPYVNLPDIKSKWVHVGHTITLRSSSPSSSKFSLCSTSNDTLELSKHSQQSSNSLNASSKSNDRNNVNRNGEKQQHIDDEVIAYRFDQKRPEIQFWKKLSSPIKNKSSAAKRDHELRSYKHVLERYTVLKLPWVNTFVGEEGRGVSGQDNELRCVV